MSQSLPRRAGLLGLGLSVAALAGLLPPSPAAGACAGGHLGVAWSSFQAPVSDFGPLFFYHAVEPVTTANSPVVIRGIGDDCTTPPQPVVGTYRVSPPSGGNPRAATSALDYSPIFPERSTSPLYGYHAQGPTEHHDSVPIQGDALIEPVAEVAQALISSSTGKRESPYDVPFYILDDDGTDRVSLESSGPYERSETYGTISVPVFRGGPANTSASFDLSVTPSGSDPATAGEDFDPPVSPVSFGAGERIVFVNIKIHNDGRAEPSEELTLTLTEPGTLLPADPTTATVRILDSLGTTSGLRSRLHHPRQRLRYGADDFRIREIHIFTTAGQGPPVTSADFALRRNSRGGKCAWWTGKRFRPGSCGEERWLKTSILEPDFFYYRLPELAPSTGKIKTYSAVSRARNGTSDIETALDRGRNFNTFEVKPVKREVPKTKPGKQEAAR